MPLPRQRVAKKNHLSTTNGKNTPLTHDNSVTDTNRFQKGDVF